MEIEKIKSPCDGCAYIIRCSEEPVACRQMYDFIRVGRWDEKDPRVPNYVDYLRIDKKVDLNEAYSKIAAVRRAAVSESRVPSISEFVEALGYSRDICFEMLCRYAKKQEMRDVSLWTTAQ